jgi:hypothetical protein
MIENESLSNPRGLYVEIFKQGYDTRQTSALFELSMLHGSSHLKFSASIL